MMEALVSSSVAVAPLLVVECSLGSIVVFVWLFDALVSPGRSLAICVVCCGVYLYINCCGVLTVVE